MTITKEKLKDGRILRGMLNEFFNAPTERNFIGVLRCLRDCNVVVPGTIKMSDEDLSRFVSAKVGDTVTNGQDIRFVPDILRKENDLYFPMFSAKEMLGEYGKAFSTIEQSFINLLDMVQARTDVKGIVVDAFSTPFIIDKAIFDFVKGLPTSVIE